jgi:hypothetical protein
MVGLGPTIHEFLGPVRVVAGKLVMEWTAPVRHRCTRMRSLWISYEGGRPWRSLSALVWIRPRVPQCDVAFDADAGRFIALLMETFAKRT